MNGGVNCTLESVSDLNRVTLKFSGAKKFNLDTLNLLKNRNYFSYKVNGPLSVYNPQIKVFSINETDFIFDMTIINTLPSVSIIIANTIFIILFKRVIDREPIILLLYRVLETLIVLRGR